MVFPEILNFVSQSNMFALSRSCRSFLKFSSLLHSTRQISSAPGLLGTRPLQFTDENVKKLSIRSFSTSKLSSKDKLQVSKIQLIAPNLRKTNRRRRPLALLYKDAENSLPKVIGMAKAESFDLCAIFEDEHFASFYQVTYVDDGTLLRFFVNSYFLIFRRRRCTAHCSTF
jgi:hypothetical protein